MVIHNDLYDGVMDLYEKVFTSTHVRNDPLILASFAVKRTKANPARSKTTPTIPQLEATEHKGNLFIRDLCPYETESFHNICVVNTYDKTNSA